MISANDSSGMQNAKCSWALNCALLIEDTQWYCCEILRLKILYDLILKLWFLTATFFLESQGSYFYIENRIQFNLHNEELSFQFGKVDM